ncbi:adenosylcobinamide-GDP ribazoletransferase [Hydrogenophaga soli]
MQGLRNLLLAVQFFTRIPVTGRLAAWVGYSPAMLRASAAHFPGVGWLVGALLCALVAVIAWALPGGAGGAGVAGSGVAPWVAAWAVALGGVWITGGFHEDGLADLADGLGGSFDRQRALEIMKDSRIGAYGAMALVLALGGRVVLWAALFGLMGLHAALPLLWLAQVASRTWPLFIIRTLAHVGDAAGSKSKPLADQISVGALAVGLVWLVAAVGVAAGWRVWGTWDVGAVADGALGSGDVGVTGGAWPALAVQLTAQLPAQLPALGLPLLASALAAAWMRRLLRRRLQGFTGDGLGAAQQVAELAFVLGALLTWRWVAA